jgi:hypothetical protein
MRSAFDAGSIHYLGKWEGALELEIKSSLGLVNWHRADRCIKELNHPARAAQVLLRPPPPIHTGHWTEQLRNQQLHIKCIIYASST